MSQAKFKVSFGQNQKIITGGPYAQKPPHAYGVKMAVEIHKPCDVDIPTRDFSVPDVQTLDNGLRKSLISIARNKDVYVGCMGGIGRTGLFMAVLAKLSGVDDPVKYVRANYKSHAVETSEQMQYVEDFEPSLKTRCVFEIAKVISLAY